ncbi:23933_t:CDS:2, partial [Racocetra persica]
IVTKKHSRNEEDEGADIYGVQEKVKNPRFREGRSDDEDEMQTDA